MRGLKFSRFYFGMLSIQCNDKLIKCLLSASLYPVLGHHPPWCRYHTLEPFFVSGIDVGDTDVDPTKEFVDPQARTGSFLRQNAIMNPRVPPRSKELEGAAADRLDHEAIGVAIGKVQTDTGVARSRKSKDEKLDQISANMNQMFADSHRERMEMENMKLKALNKLINPTDSKVEKTITLEDRAISPFDYPIKFDSISELTKEICQFCGIQEPDNVKGIVICSGSEDRKNMTLLRFMTQIHPDMEQKTLKVKLRGDQYIELLLS